MMKYKNIVWDWNGTLLDDIKVGVDTLNDMLARRGMKAVTVEAYKDMFDFPVEDFYRKVGFDLGCESMHAISLDFVETYSKYEKGVGLHAHVPKVLEKIQQQNICQYVLSALREDLLRQMLVNFSIDERFVSACGSEDIYAAGKIERGKKMLEKTRIRPQETLMVGDTVHDAQVALALGFDCLLFTGGHNSERRLVEKAPIIHDMEEVFLYLEN